MTRPEPSTVSAPRADYYALFGLEERYALDMAELERRYLERSRAAHPDRFVNAPAHERVRALGESMQLNDAYKALKSPASRAEYLLGRRGVTIGHNETLDPEFLMEILEMREELAEAKAMREVATLRRLEEAMRDRQAGSLARLGDLFARVEATGDSAILAPIKAELILLRYIRRYLEEFDDAYDEDAP